MEKHLRIVEFYAENILGLKVARIKPKGDVIELTGPNGAGKTSVLKAIIMTLGTMEGAATVPIRKGADKGGVRIDLGDLIVTLKITPQGEVLRVNGRRGEVYPSPRKMLAELFGRLSFDPLAFMRMKAKEQADELKKIVKLDVDPDAIDAANKEDYDSRRVVNRQVSELEAQRDAILVAGDLPEVAPDVSALVMQLQEAGEANAALRARTETRSQRIEQATKDLAEAGETRKRAAKMRAEAEGLDRQATAKHDSARAVLDAPAEELTEQDVTAIREQVNNARAVAAQIEKRKGREKLQAQLDLLVEQADAYTLAMKTRMAEKEAAIAKAEMPIPGLSFQGGDVYWDDLPLAQASGAEQLRVSIAIGMAGNRKAGVMLIDEGGQLDKRSMDLIKAAAAERDYQLWITRPDTSGNVGIVMSDGEVSAVNEEVAH